jgi:hypothetical protein
MRSTAVCSGLGSVDEGRAGLWAEKKRGKERRGEKGGYRGRSSSSLRQHDTHKLQKEHMTSRS